MSLTYSMSTLVELSDFPPRGLPPLTHRFGQQTAENKYWDKLKYPIVAKEFSAVTSVNFCPVAPFNFAVTSSLKVGCSHY